MTVFNRSLPSGMKPTPVNIIIGRARAAAQLMSVHNSNRNLLLNCATGMEQLVERLGMAEDKLEAAGLLAKEERHT